MERNSEEERIEELAGEILEQTRETLAMAFRYLDVALWHMPVESRTFDAPLATDCTTLFYDARRVVKRFKESPDELARDYLHLLLHCIFRQPLQLGFPDAKAWSSACDVTAELTAWEMCGSRFSCARDFELEDLLGLLKNKLGAVTPLKVYREIVAHQHGLGPSVFDGVPRDVVALWLDELVVRDSHVVWEQGRLHNLHQGERVMEEEAGDELREQPSADSILDADAGSGEPDMTPVDNEGADIEADDDSLFDMRDDAHGSRIEPQQHASAEQDWDDIRRQVEMEMRSAAMQQADSFGMLVAQIELAARKPVDFEAFLRSFASMEEDLRINDEEFDYIFYTFGFDTYGNMPLVEPLEYQELNCVREFVIAIDTSASCKGEIVQTFLTRTCEILENTAQFGRDVNIHLIQCDARVQDDLRLTSLDQLGEFTQNVQVKGLGGTDFRPVFEHVDALVEAGEFENLRGLIYFTDGKGTYPERMPSYDTVFVFLEEDGIPVSVPPWAMKVVLDERGIREL